MALVKGFLLKILRQSCSQEADIWIPGLCNMQVKLHQEGHALHLDIIMMVKTKGIFRQGLHQKLQRIPSMLFTQELLL
jgi:hypothetical protein